MPWVFQAALLGLGFAFGACLGGQSSIGFSEVHVKKLGPTLPKSESISPTSA